MRHPAATGMILVGSFLFCTICERAFALVSVAPFVSMSSTKTLKPVKNDKTKDQETIKQRTTYGIKGTVGMYSFLKFQLTLGQNQLTTTEKVGNAVDDYGDIDFHKDLNMSTDDPEKDVKTTETQRKGRASLVIDPSFSILILRAEAGVQATQRLFAQKVADQPEQKYTSPITYKPLATIGAGVKIGPRMFAMAEYSFFFYKFPKTEPFEREATISYGVNF